MNKKLLKIYTAFSGKYLILLSILFSAELVTAQVLVKDGSLFKVNTYTTSTQDKPAIASDAKGNYVIVWESEGQDGSYGGIFGQRYNSKGEKLGLEFRVNPSISGVQSDPDVAMDKNGNFVVVYRGEKYTSGSFFSVINAVRFDSTGALIGNEIMVDGSSSSAYPLVGMDHVGNFTVAWENRNEVHKLSYTSKGVKIGNDAKVSLNGTRHNIEMDSLGNYIIVWETLSNTDRRVRGRRYNAKHESIGSEFPIDSLVTGYQGKPSVSFGKNGDYIITWIESVDISDYNLYGKVFNTSGEVKINKFQINNDTTTGTDSPALSSSKNGEFAVSYYEYKDRVLQGIKVHTFKADGTLAGISQRITGVTSFYPALEMMEDGKLLVVYAYNDNKTVDLGAQFYDPKSIPTMLSESFDISVNIYPNPTSNFLFTESADRSFSYQLNSLDGMLLKEGKENSKLILDMSDIENGVYLLTLTYPEGTIVKKIVKQ